MARSHYWQYLINTDGEPINNADISIFLAETSTPIYIYDENEGGTASNTDPQLTTDELGFFEFWIEDATDPYGYSTTQKFKIQWEKIGMDTGSIDNIEIHQTRDGIDVTDTDSVKNKLVSNLLAKGWEDHKNNTSPSTVHGLGEVNETDTDTSRTKLVSNLLAKDWEDHKDNIVPHTVHGMGQVDETSSNATKNKLLSNLLAKGWEDHINLSASAGDYPHDMDGIDVTDTDATKDKLVSNLLGKGWEDHKDLDYDETPHGIEGVNESGDSSTKNKTVSNLLAKGWEDHINMFPSAGDIPHGIREVDEISGTDDDKNRLVSDVLAKGWEDHINLSVSASEEPHDIQAVDTDIDDDDDDPNHWTPNKVISNIMGKNWEDHRNTTLTTSGSSASELIIGNPHEIYTADIYDDDPELNKTISNLLAKLFYDTAVEFEDVKLRVETEEKTNDYTLRLVDQNKVVLMNVSGASTLTVPTSAVDFEIGSVVRVYNISSDNVTIQGDVGVTVRNNGALTQHKEITLRKRADNEWVLTGDLS